MILANIHEKRSLNIIILVFMNIKELAKAHFVYISDKTSYMLIKNLFIGLHNVLICIIIHII